TWPGRRHPAVTEEVARRETGRVLRRIESGRMRPASSFELSYAIVSALARPPGGFLAPLAQEGGQRGERVMAEEIGAPVPFLEERFRARHELLSVRTMATL